MKEETIPEKTNLHHWKLRKILFLPMEIPRPKDMVPGNST